MTRPTKTRAGLYEMGGWTISKTEGDERAPGYEWRAENPALGAGERFFRTKTEAVVFVRRALVPVTAANVAAAVSPCCR